jgi:murein DD-endopeptidase MepM/ murein hydrolase activator NlpD
MMSMMKNIVFFLIPLLYISCSDKNISNNSFLTKLDSILQEKEISLRKYSLDSLLCDGFDFPLGNKDGKGPYISLLDGKKYDSWHVSVPFAINYSLGIHPGEDWGGTGPSDSDLGQPVHSIAKGVVIDARDYFPPWGNIVSIRHVYWADNKIDTVLSVYIHLKDVYVNINDIVEKRDTIGTVGDGGVYRPHLHFEIRKGVMHDFMTDFWPSSYDRDKKWVLEHYESPSKFIKSHRIIE